MILAARRDSAVIPGTQSAHLRHGWRHSSTNSPLNLSGLPIAHAFACSVPLLASLPFSPSPLSLPFPSSRPSPSRALRCPSPRLHDPSPAPSARGPAAPASAMAPAAVEALHRRWLQIEEAYDGNCETDESDFSRLKEQWFVEAFKLLENAPKEEHCWCTYQKIMDPLLEPFSFYFEQPQSDLHALWRRFGDELNACTKCVIAYYESKERYKNTYHEAHVEPLLTVLQRCFWYSVLMSITSYNGSALIAMVGKNCFAIASDSRLGVNFQTIACDFQRIFKIHDNLYIGLSGLATDVQTMVQRLKFCHKLYKLREERNMRPETFASLVSAILYEKRFDLTSVSLSLVD